MLGCVTQRSGDNLPSLGLARHGSRSAPWLQCYIAIAVLVVGICVYAFARPAATSPLSAWLSIPLGLPTTITVITNSLPTFSHVFAFALLTSAWLGGTLRAGAWGCLTWLLVDSLFEFGQHDLISGIVVRLSGNGSGNNALVNHASAYLASGTFDALDLMSIVLGTAAAFLVVYGTSKRYSICTP